jgi:hypothetical protein
MESEFYPMPAGFQDAFLRRDDPNRFAEQHLRESAPDLLKSLIAAVEFADAHPTGEGERPYWYESARVAIAKATVGR